VVKDRTLFMVLQFFTEAVVVAFMVIYLFVKDQLYMWLATIATVVCVYFHLLTYMETKYEELLQKIEKDLKEDED
jgi:hypothetical protein